MLVHSRNVKNKGTAILCPVITGGINLNFSIFYSKILKLTRLFPQLFVALHVADCPLVFVHVPDIVVPLALTVPV